MLQNEAWTRDFFFGGGLNLVPFASSFYEYGASEVNALENYGLITITSFSSMRPHLNGVQHGDSGHGTYQA